MNNLIIKIFPFLKRIENTLFAFKKLKKKKSISKLFLSFEVHSKNSEIRYVGGCIRKILNNESIDDIDFAVNLKPSECVRVLKNNSIRYYETGIDHGTVTAIIDNDKFEITSLRKDINSDGRHAKVEFLTDWYEDASRRDFTINSIYSDIDGNLYDPFEGKKDLQNGEVKFIGDAGKRIQEDYIRILRYIRFFINYSKLPHNNKLKNTIKQNISGIQKISSERLLDEFKKIIQSRMFLKLFKDPFCLEIICLIFPQFKNIGIFNKLNDFTKKKLKEIDYIFLISLMILDNTDNTDYFLFKFNLSNLNKKRILFLKEFNSRKNNNSFSEKNLWKIFYYNGKKSIIDLLLFEIFQTQKINKKLIDLLSFFKDQETPVFPIKARSLMEKYHIPEGKLLGIKLKKIEEKWINNDFMLSEKEIIQILEN